MAVNTANSVKEPRVISRRSETGDSADIHSAIFCWNIKTLDRIAAEFGVDRSNEKDKTILRGFTKWANLEVAKRLVGRRFILDMRGREIPIAIGRFSKETLEVVDSFVPDSSSEPFLPDLVGEARDATKFKLFLKATLMHTRLIYTNEADNGLLMYEIIEEPKGEGVLQAAFLGGSGDENVWCSVTEITDFKLEE